MGNWKTKVFGDNQINFYGWLVGGLLAILVSLWLVIQSAVSGTFDSNSYILLAIYLVLAGQFGLQIQNYCARTAMTVESKDAMKNDTNVT